MKDLDFFYFWKEGRHYRVARDRKNFQSSDVNEETSLCSPLPGKVTQIEVSLEQIVKKGDLLLSLEAMKMEYKIQAPYNGVVKGIPFQAGDQVSMGTLLIELEKDE